MLLETCTEVDDIGFGGRFGWKIGGWFFGMCEVESQDREVGWVFVVTDR